MQRLGLLLGQKIPAENSQNLVAAVEPPNQSITPLLMKNHFSAVSKLVIAAVCALSLGSCSRAEYAMLPKGASYHGVARVAAPVPATPSVAIVVPATAPVAETAPALAVAAVPVAPAMVAVRPETAVAAAPAVSASAPSALATTSAAAPKLNLVQRMAMNKVMHKMDKMVQKSGALRQHDNTASTSKTAAISGNLRTGLIFLLVGLLISLFSGISGIFGIIGAIFAIIGLVFIILWLLDQA